MEHKVKGNCPLESFAARLDTVWLVHHRPILLATPTYCSPMRGCSALCCEGEIEITKSQSGRLSGKCLLAMYLKTLKRVTKVGVEDTTDDKQSPRRGTACFVELFYCLRARRIHLCTFVEVTEEDSRNSTADRQSVSRLSPS